VRNTWSTSLIASKRAQPLIPFSVKLQRETGKLFFGSPIILLLVSPYLLASNYCYDVEMLRAMERHRERTARVVPVILAPCDWHSAPFGSLLAVPKDGRPVSKYPNMHDAFLEVTKAIRAAVQSLSPATSEPQTSTSPVKATERVAERPRSSNLRVKKQFTERDRDRFRDDAFQ
jgi:hypothetical protein